MCENAHVILVHNSDRRDHLVEIGSEMQLRYNIMVRKCLCHHLVIPLREIQLYHRPFCYQLHRYVQFSLITIGVYASRMWTAGIAATLLYLSVYTREDVEKLQRFFYPIGWG